MTSPTLRVRAWGRRHPEISNCFEVSGVRALGGERKLKSIDV
jgi:hypothetical protein